MNLLDKYKKGKLLEKRLSKLESLITERSIGKGGDPSKAYQIWDYLMTNGSKSVADLKRALPSSVTNFINFYADNNLLIKNSDGTISANAGYAWDDRGVIPRTAYQELMNDLANGNIPSLDEIPEAPGEETPAEEPVRGRGRTPRARQVKQDLFSRKIEEVKAAIDAGQDVNAKDDKDRSPLGYACASRKGDTGAIIKALLDAGADPNTSYNNRPCVGLALQFDNAEGAKALALAGAKLDGFINQVSNYCFLVELAMRRYVTADEFMEILDKDFTANTEDYLSRFKEIIDSPYFAFNKPEAVLRKVVRIIANCNMDDKLRFSRLPYVSKDYKAWLDIYVDEMIKNNMLPRISSTLSFYGLSECESACRKIYDNAEKIGDGTIKFDDGTGVFFDALSAMCKWFKWPLDNLSKILTQKYMDGVSQRVQWVDLLYEALSNKDKDSKKLLEVLSGLRFKEPDASSFRKVMRYVAILDDSAKTRLACKKMRPYVKTHFNDDNDYYFVSDIASSRNEYLLSFIMDTGGKPCQELLADSLKKSSVCIDLLRDAGYVFDDNNPSGGDTDRDRQRFINKILNHISRDTMDADIRNKINADPSILADETIQNALDEPENNNVTTRQLKAQYDRWYATADTADKAKYEM